MIGRQLPKETADMRYCRTRMSRYDGLLRQADSLWQRERATKVLVEGARA